MARRWALVWPVFWVLSIFFASAFAQNIPSSSASFASQDAAPQSRSSAADSTLKTSTTASAPADIFTATVQSLPTAPFLTTVTSATFSLPTSVYTFYPLYENNTHNSLATTINTTSEDVANICWYPISGSYGLLPRILFYITIVAALLLRHHQWLYAGALVAALTYSGSAAIHACLLIWRGPGYGELDGLALLVILGTSCIITVPLLNWSSTLRNIGKNVNEGQELPENEKTTGHTDIEFDVASRTIVLYWGFLVMVGFLCIYVAVPVLFWNPHSIGSWQLISIGGVPAISCSPPGGQLNLSAGQSVGWAKLVLTTEFIDINNCGNPCAYPAPTIGRVIFRSDLDLTTVDESTTNRLFGGQTTEQAQNDEFLNDYVKWVLISLPYILAQGFWAALFGRRTPAQVRNVLYSYLTRIRLSKTRSPLDPVGPVQRAMAMFVALLAYSWAVLILVVSVPLFVLNMVALEMFLYDLPQSETNNHIGAWSPWASVGLALVAAFFARYHGDIEYLIRLSTYKLAWLGVHPSWIFLQLSSLDRQSGGEVRAKNIFTGEMEPMPDRHLYRKTSVNIWARTYGKSSNYVRSKAVNSLRSLLSEWNQFVEFCTGPDFSRRNQGRVHRLNVRPCSCVVACQCSLMHVQGDCRHEPICKRNNVCRHESKCRHSSKCKRARRMMLLAPERMTVPMALTAFHGQKFQLDMAGTPIPLRDDGQSTENPTTVYPIGTHPVPAPYDLTGKESEASDDSVMPTANWHPPQMPVQPPQMLLSRFWKRNGTYDQVVEEKQNTDASEKNDMRPSELTTSRPNSYKRPSQLASQHESSSLLKGNALAGKGNTIVHPEDHPGTVSRIQTSNLSVDESRRVSMARPLPPVPLHPGFLPRTPYSTPNPKNRSSASAASAISALSPATQQGYSFDNMTEDVSPENGQTPERQGSDKGHPENAEQIQPYDGDIIAEDDIPRKIRSSTGLASSFEEGIMQRQRRSRAYASDLSPNWQKRSRLTHSATAPIPVHTEEDSHDDSDPNDTFDQGQTPSDFAGSLPPAHFFDNGESDDESSGTNTTPRASPRRSFTSSAPDPPSLRLSSDDPAAETMVPSGIFLTPTERHYLLDPPSGASTPPIQLPPLSPANPASNAARTGDFLPRSPHLSLGSAIATPARVMSMASMISGARPGPASFPTGGASRDSGAGTDGEASASGTGSPGSSGRRSTVSYLQVQRPNTILFADEITLRKDEMGVYRLVMNGNDAVEER